jgi:hypothetical protein
MFFSPVTVYDRGQPSREQLAGKQTGWVPLDRDERTLFWDMGLRRRPVALGWRRLKEEQASESNLDEGSLKALIL